MSDELLEDYTRQYIEAQRVPEVTFAWQGGEPTLMGLDFFRKAVDLQEKYRRPGMKILNAFQTNGTLLDEDWCRFFHEHNFLIGLSIDGPRALHDTYRLDKGGQPTFDRVMRAAELLQASTRWSSIRSPASAPPTPPTGWRCTASCAMTLGSRFIQFIPIVERENATGFQEGARLTKRSVSGKPVRALPDRHLRRMGAPRRGQGLCADLRRGPGGLGRAAPRAVHLRRNLRLRRWRWSSTATCMPATTSSSRAISWATSPAANPAPWPSWPVPRNSAASAWPSATGCRASAASARCASSATAAAPKDRMLHTPDGEPGLN